MHPTEVEQIIERILVKTQEISGMMKDGKFIVAYEKLGGVQKNLASLHSMLVAECYVPPIPAEKQ